MDTMEYTLPTQLLNPGQRKAAVDSTDHRFVVGTVAAAETQPLNLAQRAAAQRHHHLLPQTTDSSSELSRNVIQEIKVALNRTAQSSSLHVLVSAPFRQLSRMSKEACESITKGRRVTGADP